MKNNPSGSKHKKNFLSRLIEGLGKVLSLLSFLGGIALMLLGGHTFFTGTLKTGLTYFLGGAGLILAGFLISFLLDLLAKGVARLFPSSAEKAKN